MNNLSNQHLLLIVDDVSINIKILSHFLKNIGFKLLVAQNGKQAVQIAEYAHPDLILMDVLMPEMNGFDACCILKSKKDTREIPIIFTTALADTVDKVKGFELGAADYITKPFQQEEVLARINAHLNLSKLRRQLQARNLELERRNIQLDAFAHTVAHDLKNPLSVVTGYANLLTKTHTDNQINDELKSYVHSIIEAGNKMEGIVNALLLLARTSKDENVDIQPLDMFSIVAQAQIRLAHKIQDCQAEINIADKFPIAKGYAPWVEEIWANYISNGIKYGGSPPRLEIGADVQDDMIRFWVRDNGPGLSEKSQAELFTPFTRLHQDRAEGHGLGLSIVHQIVEKLNGKVGVESTVGQGSTFYFTLSKEGNPE